MVRQTEIHFYDETSFLEVNMISQAISQVGFWGMLLSSISLAAALAIILLKIFPIVYEDIKMSKSMIRNDVITKELLDHLGLKNCDMLDFHFETNRHATVTARIIIDSDAGKEFVKIIKKYNLVEDDRTN